MIEHLNLLSETEITELYTLPCFNEEERRLYFAIENEREADALQINTCCVFFTFTKKTIFSSSEKLIFGLI
jgi:hypothetical protein